MSFNIQPLSDYVVVQRDKAEPKTTSGIFLPDNAQEKPEYAKVLTIGKDVKHVKVGDQILYKKYSGNEFKLNNEEYVLVKEEDILGTVK